MKNQILKTVLTIQTRLNSLRDKISMEECIQINAKDLEIISLKFNLDSVQSLLLASTFIETVDRNRSICLDNIARRLEIETLELLC